MFRLLLQLLPRRIEDDRALWILHPGSSAGAAENPPETGRGAQAADRPEEFAEEFASLRQRGFFYDSRLSDVCDSFKMMIVV